MTHRDTFSTYQRAVVTFFILRLSWAFVFILPTTEMFDPDKQLHWNLMIKVCVFPFVLFCGMWKYGAQTVLWKRKKGRKEKHKHAISFGCLPWHGQNKCLNAPPAEPTDNPWFIYSTFSQSFFSLINLYFEHARISLVFLYYALKKAERTSAQQEGTNYLRVNSPRR